MKLVTHLIGYMILLPTVANVVLGKPLPMENRQSTPETSISSTEAGGSPNFGIRHLSDSDSFSIDNPLRLDRMRKLNRIVPIGNSFTEKEDQQLRNRDISSRSPISDSDSSSSSKRDLSEVTLEAVNPESPSSTKYSGSILERILNGSPRSGSVYPEVSSSVPDECSICLQPLKNPDGSQLPNLSDIHCEFPHLMHKDCADRLIRSNPAANCPTCREPLHGCPHLPTLEDPTVSRLQTFENFNGSEVDQRSCSSQISECMAVSCCIGISLACPLNFKGTKRAARRCAAYCDISEDLACSSLGAAQLCCVGATCFGLIGAGIAHTAHAF